VSLLTQRRSTAPFGLEGGSPGAVGRNRVVRHATGEIVQLAGQVELALEAGDELWIETPGGGGFGPAELPAREP
jgi:5-oxoprolinase (ATP-hydrolysing)